MEFLKQDWSGRIYVKTEVLAKRKDMSPYVWPEPPVDINSMDKDQLEAYAVKTFGVDLNKRKSLKNLIEEVEGLMGALDGDI